MCIHSDSGNTQAFQEGFRSVVGRYPNMGPNAEDDSTPCCEILAGMEGAGDNSAAFAKGVELGLRVLERIQEDVRKSKGSALLIEADPPAPPPAADPTPTADPPQDPPPAPEISLDDPRVERIAEALQEQEPRTIYAISCPCDDCKQMRRVLAREILMRGIIPQ